VRNDPAQLPSEYGGARRIGRCGAARLDVSGWLADSTAAIPRLIIDAGPRRDVMPATHDSSISHDTAAGTEGGIDRVRDQPARSLWRIWNAVCSGSAAGAGMEGAEIAWSMARNEVGGPEQTQAACGSPP